MIGSSSEARWKIVLLRRVVAGPLRLPGENDDPSIEGISSGLWMQCASITPWKVWDLFRERVESVGTEEERFNRLFVFLVACGCIEAGNEAEGEIGLRKGWGGGEEVFGRRRGLGGGVGGVAIQIGVEGGNKMRIEVDGRGLLGDRGSARATWAGSRGIKSDVVEGIASNTEKG